jgi:hypothetical protein
MASCEFCGTCSFFNEELPDKPYTKELLCDDYCKNNFTKCARYKVALSCGIENVPHNFFPNDFKSHNCYYGR